MLISHQIDKQQQEAIIIVAIVNIPKMFMSQQEDKTFPTTVRHRLSDKSVWVKRPSLRESKNKQTNEQKSLVPI